VAWLDGHVTSFVFISELLCASQTITIVSSYVTLWSSLISGAGCEILSSELIMLGMKRGAEDELQIIDTPRPYERMDHV
jgi:hypothetical protein